MDELKFLSLPIQYHLVTGTFLRWFLIIYGDFHDKMYDVPYTDVDYKVFTDAARYIAKGYSPYTRHTFRYSPIIAYILIPNLFLGKNFGKILFSLFDMLITLMVKSLVEHQLGSKRKNVSKIATYSSLFWIYNPMSIGISTRGNADSFSSFLIMLSIYFLETDMFKGILKFALSGIFLGISIHLRIYPLAFSFPMYLALGEYKITRRTSIRDGILSLTPNKKQLILASSCIMTLFSLTYAMYSLYGYEFFFETYIYHIIRKDTRHNFSVLFYYTYLTIDQSSFDIVRFVSLVFECLILFLISLTMGCDLKTLPFGLFCQAVVLVAYNSVMTSQYFIWFLSLLPLVIQDLNIISSKGVLLSILWLSAQGAWLFYAYILEFKCREVFILIWLKGVVFFCGNVFVLCQLIKSYTPGHAFGENKNK